MRDTARSEAGRELSSLLDSAFGVQFRGLCRAADDVVSNPFVPHAVFQVAYRLLSRADHHIVDGEHPSSGVVGTETDVQTLIVDPLVVDAA